jgi:hypothetical protein
MNERFCSDEAGGPGSFIIISLALVYQTARNWGDDVPMIQTVLGAILKSVLRKPATFE